MLDGSAIFSMILAPPGIPASPLTSRFLSSMYLARRLRLVCTALAPLAFGLGVAGSAPDTSPATIRIAAGFSAPLKDERGHTWLAGEGFVDGETNHRPGVAIANTDIPSLYQAERFDFTRFSRTLPNGNYIVKLHFAVTYESIEGPGQCVFSFDVEGKTFKDYDVFAKAGGARRALVETVPVTIADGELTLKFTPQRENTSISGIEIVTAP